MLSKLFGCVVMATAMAATGLIGATGTKSGAAKDKCDGTKDTASCKNGTMDCNKADIYVKKANLNDTYDAIIALDDQNNSVPAECPPGCTIQGGAAIKPLMGPTDCSLQPKGP